MLNALGVHNFPEPLVLVDAAGTVLQANPAFLALARRHGVEPTLTGLFGEGVLEHLRQVREQGQTRSSFMVGGEGRLTGYYRASFASAGETTVVLLVDFTDEMLWRKQLFERNRDLTVLADIGSELSFEIELDALCERIWEQSTRIMSTATFYIAIHDQASGQVSFPFYIEEGVRCLPPARTFSNGLTEHVLRTAEPLWLGEGLLEEARRLGIEPVGRPCQTWLGVPLLSDGEAIGVMALQDFERADAFEPHDLEVLSVIASQAAAALRNARLLSAARKAYEQLAETQARLLESERLRGVTETVGALNHEVNNPLATIAGNAQLLLRQSERLPDGVRAKLEAMLEATQRIERVTTRMATLIHAHSRPYPGNTTIIDVERSVARNDPGLRPPAGGVLPDPAKS